jgi:hypothetical protein
VLFACFLEPPTLDTTGKKEYTSIGGFLGGLLEALFDKEGLPLNGKIVV